MEEIKELETLETTEGTYNSFPDQAARKELKAKLSAPEGLKPGMLLKVKSLQADGAVVLEGVVPTEAGEHPDNPVVDGITVGGENGVRFDSEGEPSAPILALYGAQGAEPVRVSHVAPAQEDGEAVPLGQVKELIHNQDSGQNVDLTGYATEQWVMDYGLPRNLGAENVGKVLVVGGDGNIVLTELPQGGDVTGTLDENNNILLSGDLTEGTYPLKWRNADGTYSDAGAIVVGPVEPEATNYFDASTALLNHRLGSSGSPSAYDGMVVTDFIPVDSFATDDILAISGVTLVSNTAYNYARRTVWYNADKTKIADNNGIDYDARYMIPVQPEAGGASYLRVAMVIKDGAALTAADIADLKITLT